jgi:PEP-CTERM motif
MMKEIMRQIFMTLTAITMFGLTTSMHATTLLSENFNELTPQLSVTSAGEFQTINGTNVDVVGAANGYAYLCAAPEGGNCIDLDGTGGNPQGQLRSNQLFAAGTYLLSFDLIGNERGSTSSATVTFGNYDESFTLASADTTSGIVTDELVTLSTPGYLLFTSNDFAGDEQGPALDNVTVSTVGGTMGATPEPSSIVLLGTGLLSVAGALRKRFA